MTDELRDYAEGVVTHSIRAQRVVVDLVAVFKDVCIALDTLGTFVCNQECQDLKNSLGVTLQEMIEVLDTSNDDSQIILTLYQKHIIEIADKLDDLTTQKK